MTARAHNCPKNSGCSALPRVEAFSVTLRGRRLARRRSASIYGDVMASSCRWMGLGLGLVALLGCGGGSSSPSPSAAGSAGTGGSGGGNDGVAASELPYAPCPIESGVGEFLIELGADYTSVEGQVFDGVVPGFVPAELMSEGVCRLVTLPTLSCDPACPASTQTCGADNQCLPLPVAHDVGTVTVSGLARAVEMTAASRTGSYRPPPPALPHPGFAPGADLRVAASGGDYEPFTLRGWGVSALEVAPDPIVVTEGQPLALRWTAPADAGPARVAARLNVNNHGSSTTAIECDFPDTGSAQIPASLIDGLVALGASGFPTLTIGRRTATSASITPGCVQLLVRSEVTLDASLSGLVSCDTDAECPDGQTCKPIERFCE